MAIQTSNESEAERPSSIFPLPRPSVLHTMTAPPFPSKNPKQYPLNTETCINFDPTLHLAQPLEVPQHIKVLQQNDEAGPGCVKLVQVPSDILRKMHVEDLAYTEPFRVLSEEGVQAFRRVIAENKEMAICTPRNPQIIRALGFASKFVKDFNESPQLLEHLGKFANAPIAAHPMTTNYSQINYGEPPKPGEEEAKPADVCHLDSVDYVLVVLMADGFEGGELLVSNMVS